MPSCAQVLAQALSELGIKRMFGFPGGEVLDLMEACRTVGIDFLLTRDEATAAFMADVTGQLTQCPGVCVSTLGPGALNMALGVANAYLDRSPVIAITASIAASAGPYATHQNIDLNSVYGAFTKLSVTLDAVDTATVVKHAYDMAVTQRMGPVHLALPSDVARSPDRSGGHEMRVDPVVSRDRASADNGIESVARAIRGAGKPIVVLGFDLDPKQSLESVRRFVDKLGVPVFVTPKAKGMLPEDHELFFGVCAGVAADNLVVDFMGSADLLVGVGFDPVESNKLWHNTMKLVSISPASIAVDEFRPFSEAVGDVVDILTALYDMDLGSRHWSDTELNRFRDRFAVALRPSRRPEAGLSGYEVTRRLRQLLPRDTVHVTDVGSVKFVTSQVWTTYEPRTFLVSNGLSCMGYALPGAMAAKLHYPDRPVVCTIGDGGLGMTISDLETCARRGINVMTVVYNDSSLSLINVLQQNREYPTYGVDFGTVDFRTAAEGFGAWAARIETMDELDSAIEEAQRVQRPAVLDVVIDPFEYRTHAAPDF